MIPQILHQVWLGGPVHPVWAEMSKSWRRFHPGWDCRFWTDAEAGPFVEVNYPEFQDLYECYSYPIQKADLLRYLLLHRFGGVYVDMDIECLRPIDDLLAGREALVVEEPGAHALERGIPTYLSNSFIAAEPGHPLLAALLHAILQESALAVTHQDVLEMTGPHKLDSVYRAGTYPDVVILDAARLSPCPRETSELRELLKMSDQAGQLRSFFRGKGAYGIHYWAMSWFNLSGQDLINPEPHKVEGFVFFPGSDSAGHAIRHAGRNVPELAKLCLACEEAVGFNTDGFLKSRILPKRYWDRREGSASCEGLYIKKSVLQKPLWQICGLGR